MVLFCFLSVVIETFFCITSCFCVGLSARLCNAVPFSCLKAYDIHTDWNSQSRPVFSDTDALLSNTTKILPAGSECIMHIVFYGEDLTSLWEVEIDAVDVQKKKQPISASSAENTVQPSPRGLTLRHTVCRIRIYLRSSHCNCWIFRLFTNTVVALWRSESRAKREAVKTADLQVSKDRNRSENSL